MHLRLIAALLLLTGALLSGLALAVRQPAGTLIGTATHVDYTINGVRGFLTTESNIPWIEIQPLPSHSALTLMRAAEHGGTEDAIITDVAFALSPDSSDLDSFVPQDETPLGGKHVIRVIRSGGFMPGETVFIRLRDPGLNHLPDVAETVLVRLASENGDVEMFRMAAAGPDSPDFYGYAVVAAADDVVRGDGRISGAPNTVIEARYVDPFETEDESVSYAVVDPSLRVFDATTGVPLDGARLRVIDMGAGREAQVFGIGGEAAMVGEIVSGQDLSDADGHVYSADTGEAIMPHLRAGRYRIEVEPPPGYVFPSDAGDATIASFGQNYRLGTGARGGEFEIDGGGPPQFDLPLDPRGSFFLRRSVSRSEVAIGDTIGFTMTLTNDDARDATGIEIAERLPRGFRLVEGSVRIDGGDTGDPERSADGESFSFDIESLKSGRSVRIAYAVRVSAGAGFGFFEALASARAPNGFRSNAARIGLTVRDALGTADGHVMGAVLAGPCDAQGQGVRARLVTETGSLIDTDGDGRFHISGLRPGLHALRLDETSLPDWLVPMACPGDLRPGDTTTARTIETRGGMLRGVAFRVRDTRAPTAGAGTSQAAGQADPSAEAVTSPRAMTASAPPANTPLDLTATAKPVKVWTPEDLAAFDGLTLAYPQAGAPPEGPLLDLGIAYPFGHRLEVRINGQPVPEDRYEGVIGNRTARIAMRQWRGIETGPGPVEISAIMRDKAGNETGRLFRRLGDAGASSDTAEAGVPVPLTTRHIQPSPVAENRVDGRSEPSPAPAAPARHIHDADDLATLPQAAQILYPGDVRGIEGGQFELGILHPFGTRVEAFVDGKEIDRKHVEKSIVNRRAKLVLRRWSGIPATADEVAVTAIIHHRDGTEERLTRQLKTAPAAALPLATVPDIPAPGAPAVMLPTQAADSPDDPPLAALPRRLQIVYPAEGASLPDPSLRLGIAHPVGARLDVTVAGVPLDGRSAEKSVTDKASGMVMRRWRGVDLADGETLVVARLLAPDGTVLEETRRSVHYVTEAADAVLLPQKSTLVADGRSAPVIAVRVTDDAGRPLHAGRRIEAVLAPPYQSAVSFERFENDPLAASGSTRTALVVGEDGIARLTLRPTTQTGEVDLRVRIGTREKRLRPWMAASARPWIVVGIAEGTIGHAGISGNMEAAERAGAGDEIYTDGRIAFYAKGAIRGEWLLTVAYDSDADFDRDAVRERIDPDAYYPVYGDASVRQEDAQSRYPLYVRLERGTFYALFGDYDTGLNRTELGAYTRTMSGFKTVYEGPNTSVVAFAAEADRQYRRVELQANLGVGPYALGGPATLNSETVRIVTRNRDRLDETLSETVLAPFLDYDIDHSGGLVTLRLPPEPVDSDFNPRFVVVEFERDAADPGRFTVGGRVARRFLDDRAELGATAIHEEGNGIDARGDLVALDGRIDVTDALTLEGEVAASRVSEDGVTREGQAYRAEARYMAEGWRARIYMHEADPDFGVSAQSVGRIGRRVVGAELTAEVADPFAPDIDGEGTPRMLDIEAEAYRDEALDSNARRDAVELTVSREMDLGSLGRGETTLGYRGEHDRTVSGDTASAHRLIGRMTADVLGGWAAVTVEREQALFSDGDATPDATRAGVTARLTDRIDGRLGVEASDEGDVNAIAGISARAWEGGRVEAGLMGTQPGDGGGAQVNATLGVQQDFALTDTVSLTLRGARTQALAGSDSPVASTLFRSAAAEDTTTLSAGVGYRGDAWRTSVKLDTLHRRSGDSYNLGGAVLRDSSGGLTLAAAFDARHAETLGNPAQTASLTLASAWRSDDGRSAALQRLDLLFDDSADDSRKVIHSITATRDIGERLTLGGAHALRLARIRTLGETYETVTQFVAADIFYRLAAKWRLGFHGDALFDLKSGEAAYSYGGSVGYSPRAGMNLALGYTVEGFEDEDFAAANFTRQGAWLRLGLRFSETDLGTIMPRAVADALE